MTSRTGKQLNRLMQNSICWIVIILVVVLFVVPLYLFYNSDNQSYYEIIAASLNISLFVGKGQKITTMLESARLSSNSFLFASNRTVVDILQRNDNLKKYDPKRFIVRSVNGRE